MADPKKTPAGMEPVTRNLAAKKTIAKASTVQDDTTAEGSTTKPTTKKKAEKKKNDKTPTVGEKAVADADSKNVGARLTPKDSPIWLKNFFIKHNNALFKSLLVASVILPLAPSIALLAFIVPERTFGGSLATWVVENRANVQVVVSILVSTLTYLNVLLISRLLVAVGIHFRKNFVFKFLLTHVGLEDKDDGDDDDDDKKKKSSDKEDFNQMKKWYEFMTGGKWTWKDFFIGCSCFVLLYFPHIIWTGTLTPSIITVPVGTDNFNSVPHNAPLVPVYSAQTVSNWANNDKTSGAECFNDFKTTTPQQQQSFSGCAAAVISNNGVFQNIEMASAISSLPSPMDPDLDWPHAKTDNTTYTYYGRSYGVGSASGVQYDWSESSRGIYDSRFYNESGFWTDVHCSRNETSAFKLLKSNSSGINIFTPSGYLPNDPTAVTNYPMAANINVNDSVAWATSSFGNEHVLAIAAHGGNYTQLNNIQCTITFSPATYFVYNSYNGSYITVTREQTVGNFNHDGLANTAMNQLGKISQFQASSFTSDLGDALLFNADMHAIVRTNDSISDPTTEDIDYLDGVADAITISLDDILAYVGASQFAQTIGPGSLNIDYFPVYQRVLLGTKHWIAIAMFLTGILFILGVSRAIFKVYRSKHPKPSDREGKVGLVEEVR